MTPDGTQLSPADSQPARNISCDVELARLRDAWRAVSTVSGDGSFTLAISRDAIRLLAQGQVVAQATMPIANATGLSVGEEFQLSLSNDSLAALGHGDLEKSGNLSLGDVKPEEGFVGILKLQTSFAIKWPYTLTKIGSAFIEEDTKSSLQSIDPRTLRQALAEIRDFAGEDDRAGNHLSTLQICDEEAVGMSPAACHSVKADRLSGISFRVPVRCSKVLSPLLGQLRPSETQGGVLGDKCVLRDGCLTIVAPLAPALPKWPDGGSPKAQFQLDVADLTGAIGAIVWQANKDNPVVALNVQPEADALILTTAVPGGLATASCPIASANRVQEAELTLRFRASTLSSFSTRNDDAVLFQVFEHFVQIEQVSSGERRKTLLAVERPRSYS